MYNPGMPESKARPAITEFHDYRLFLKALFLWKKSGNKGFSYEYCAKRIRLSKSYLKQVFGREIHVRIDRISAMASLFRMSAFERQYFAVLLIENQVREPQMKRYFKEILQRLRANEEIAGLKDFRAKSNAGEAQMAGWLAPTIGALTRLQDFRPDARWIQNILSGDTPLPTIEETLQAMLERKVIAHDGKSYREKNFRYSPDPFEAEGYRRFLSGVLKAEEVLSGNLEGHRPATFSHGAYAVDEGGAKKIMDSYYRFLEELVRIAESTEAPNRVMFLSGNLFHVTKDLGSATERKIPGKADLP